MAAIYQKASEAEAILKRLLSEKFPDLLEVDIRGECWLVSDDKGLRLHGYSCYATIRIYSYKDRAQGKPDFGIEIDAIRWQELSERQREALLHHELTHLVVQRGKEGVKLDDLGRPKLKMRLHDFQVGIFKDTIQQYGTDAVDLLTAKPLVDWVQTLLPWG